jgi:hypothetical protein
VPVLSIIMYMSVVRARAQAHDLQWVAIHTYKQYHTYIPLLAATAY